MLLNNCMLRRRLAVGAGTSWGTSFVNNEMESHRIFEAEDLVSLSKGSSSLLFAKSAIYQLVISWRFIISDISSSDHPFHLEFSRTVKHQQKTLPDQNLQN